MSNNTCMRGNYRGWGFSRPRDENESYETYRKSLKIQGFMLASDLKPRMFWSSTENGTYRTPAKQAEWDAKHR